MRKSKTEKLLLIVDAIIKEMAAGLPSYKGVKFGDIKDKGVYERTFYHLKDQGYLEEVENKTYKLSNKGLFKIFSFRKKEKWDRKWRILTFDIPEKIKYKRDFFRNKIRELGFKYIQKSVWICPWDISEEIEYLIDYLDIHENVFYFISDAVVNENDLKNQWNLK